MIYVLAETTLTHQLLSCARKICCVISDLTRYSQFSLNRFNGGFFLCFLGGKYCAMITVLMLLFEVIAPKHFIPPPQIKICFLFKVFSLFLFVFVFTAAGAAVVVAPPLIFYLDLFTDDS